MTLYEIDSKIADLIEKVDPETGEVGFDPEELEALQMERDAKVENVALAIKNISAEADAIANEIKALTARKKTAENKVESLKRYLQNALQGEKFKTAKVAVSYKNSKAVIVEDGFVNWAAENDDSLLKYAEPAVDKKAVGEKLKAGAEIPFARFEERTSVIIK